jgi:four helix bundle protein
MARMATTPLEKLRVYKMAEELADQIWDLVESWGSFPKSALGSQLVRTADSIGANVAEGYCRGSYADNRRFVRIARGSLYETRHFLRRAYKRGLVPKAKIEKIQKIVTQLPVSLNAYIKAIGTKKEEHVLPNDK